MANPTTSLTPQHKERALQAPGLFACACEVSEQWIDIGVLILDSEAFEELSGRPATLYSIDDESRSYPVQLPPFYAFVNSKIRVNRIL
jgi:hypothetical protein